MFQLQLENLLSNLSVAAAGLAVAWAFLRLVDLSNGISFRDALVEILAGSVAAGIYYGGRIVGVLVLVGLCLSRVPV